MAVIGTAGRRDDRSRMNKNIWLRMRDHLYLVLDEQKPNTLVSGGAPWADHLAVVAFLQGRVKNLHLELPSPFINGKFVSKDWNSPGGTLNYYHKRMGYEVPGSLIEIQSAIDRGARVTVSPGFKARNTQVATKSADYLLAFTWGARSCLARSSDQAWSNALDAGLKQVVHHKPGICLKQQKRNTLTYGT